MSTCIDTGTEEGDAMLRHTHRVVGTDDDLQLTLQVSGTLGEVRVLVTFRIVLRSVHVAFAIHHFVHLPVDDRTTGYTYLEHVVVGQHQVGSHEATEAPAMYTDAVGIHIAQGLQEFHTLHLVLHFFYTELAVCHVLEFQATVGAAAIVDGEHHITLLSHVEVPTTDTVIVGVGDVLCMRTAVYVDDGRILLACIEVHRLHEAIVQVRLAIGGLDGTEGDFRHVVCLHRVSG